jgi:ABC-type lipoprotein export system ATPase subunit
MVTHDPHVASYADRQLHLIDGQLADAHIIPDGRGLASPAWELPL